MLTRQNTAISGALSGLVDKAGAKIASAIQNASAKTGVDFSYLLQQAKIESSFKADAKAKTSSATGLYQFIDKTWLSMVDKYGDKYGISDTANKKDILALRNNPEICSLMAAEFASDNKDHLEKCTGREVGATELYMAHFMGAGGATKFLNALDKNPNATAATFFPDAARANKNVFYDKSGNAKTLAQVYAQFDQKFAIKADEISSPTVAETSTTTEKDNAMVTLTTAYPVDLRTPRAELYTNTSSLYTNMDPLITSDDTQDLTLTIPKHYYSVISPIDVFQLMKTQDSESRHTG